MRPPLLLPAALAVGLAANGCATVPARPADAVGAAVAVCPVDGRPLPAVGPEFFSVSTKELRPTDPDLGEISARLRAAGAHHAGTKIHWELLEPVRGRWRWEQYDPLQTAFAEHGLAPFVTLRGTAPWASSAPDAESPQLYPPVGLAGWEGFVEAVVGRYGPPGGGPVRDWEIWNEPHVPLYFRGSRDDYLVLLDAAYARIKALDPGARVWAPAVAFHPWNVPRALDWLRAVIEHGSFDGVSIHLYFDDLAPMLDTVAAVRDLLAAAGRADTPLAVTELNQEAILVDCPGYGARPESEHARWLEQALACLAGAGIERAFYFKATDRVQVCPAPDEALPLRNGLLDEHGLPKLRYRSFSELAHRAGSAAAHPAGAPP